MNEQLIVITVVIGMLWIGSEWLRRKFTKESLDHVMARFRTASGSIVELRLPYNGSWVIAPRKFGVKGTMRYGLREDACWDDLYPRGLFKWLQVKIKTIDYVEGEVEPFIKRSPLIEVPSPTEEDPNRTVWVDPKPVVSATLLGQADDEKSGDVMVRAAEVIQTLQDQLNKRSNPKLMVIIAFATFAAAVAAAYYAYQLSETFELIRAGMGI